jgi:hypothetical protein
MEEKEDEGDASKRTNPSSETPGKRKTSNSSSNISKHVALLSISMAIVGVLVYYFVVDPLVFQQDDFYESYLPSTDNIDPQVFNLFMSYDENLDGRIDPREFVPIANRLQENQVINQSFLSFIQNNKKSFLLSCFA